MTASRRALPALCALLVLATLALYWDSLDNAFQSWDEGVQVVDNPHIRAWTWGNLRWMFTDLESTHWTPLGWLSHTATWTLFGPQPFWHHLVSAGHHALNAVVLLLLTVALRRARARATGAADSLPEASWLPAAALAALLFAVHPLQVEAVAWLVSRKDLLCFLFLALALLAYLRYLEAGSAPQRGRRYALFLGLYALALMAKSIAVTLPVLLLLVDLYARPGVALLAPRGAAATRWPPWRDKLAPLLLALAAALLAVHAARHGGSLVEITQHGAWDRALVALGNLPFYLSKLALPLLLSPYYPIPEAFTPVHYAAALVGVGLLLLLGWGLLRALRTGAGAGITLALLAGLVLLLPVIGVSQNGRQLAADRYAYLAAAPLFVLLAHGLAAAFRAPRARLPAAAAALLLAALLGYRTLLQFEVWRSPVSFWEHVASLAPYSELAQVNLGLQYQGLGQPQLALQRLETAAALDGQPGNRVNDAGIAYDGILILLADLNLRLGRHAAALDNLQQAEAYNAGNPDIALLRQVVQAASGDPTGR